MAIRKLSPLLINQIAAGEVIERPASVVKELIENAIDAGATRIDIAIEDGGRQLIRISDNGAGIPPDELPLAVAPHATSKLSEPEDLAAIGTLGFRGEAIASIASVSRLRIASRPTIAGLLADAGATIEVSGDEVSPVRPTACSPGTVVEVRDLFFNTPARRKFMRGAPTEFGHISDITLRIAMMQPGISFLLAHNERKVIDVAPVQGPLARRQRCIDLLGKDLDEALLEFEHVDTNSGTAPSVWGLAGLPGIARATAKFQYISLNGRPMRDRGIAHAIKEAYRGLVPPDKQPVVVLEIDVDPAAVDVNVHPAKNEVRFHEPNRMHGLVLHAIRQRLLGADLTPTATFNRPTFHETAANPALADTLKSEPVTSAQGASAFVEYFKQMDPKQKGFVYQQVKEELAKDRPEIVADDSDFDSPGGGVIGDPAGNGQGRLDMAAASRLASILQVHQSYIVTQDEQGILIVDQHALHERVMFEQLRSRVLAGPLESQRLLMPAVLQASAKRIASLDALKPLFDRIGIEAEPFGETSIAIHAFASFLFDRKVDPVEFVEELLDRVEESDFDLDSFARSETALEAALHEVLDMMSCKAAVKAGDQLTEAELNDLLAKRAEIERASNCPHGRPTSIRLTLRDLEKQFKRT